MVIVMQRPGQLPIYTWTATLAVILATGCRTAPVAPGEGFPGDQPVRPAPAVASTDLMEPRDATVVYKVTEGPDAGRDLVLVVVTDDQGWIATLTGWNRVRMTRSEQGAVLTHFDVDLASKVRVDYDPPITILPPRLAVGKPFEGDCRVQVRNLDDGSLRTRGTCQYRVELIGRQIVTTPAGEFDAFLVRTHRHMKLTLADAVITTLDAYGPQRGQVAHRLVKKVRLLGLVPTQSSREMRLRAQ